MENERFVLIVEDSDEDFTAMMWAWEDAGIDVPVIRCANGASALDCLTGPDSGTNRPSLVLLDLNLPGIDGRAVLAAIKTHASLMDVPIVILTTSANPKDRSDCHALGAADYIQKPMDLDRLQEILCKLASHWLGDAAPSGTATGDLDYPLEFREVYQDG